MFSVIDVTITTFCLPFRRKFTFCKSLTELLFKETKFSAMFSALRQACVRTLGAARGVSRTAVCYGSNIGANLHKVNDLERRFLVWTGKYKTVAEVPDMVAGEVMERARNRMRIRVANIMMASTLVACLVMAISGKRAHERGESVQKENQAWHKSFEETK